MRDQRDQGDVAVTETCQVVDSEAEPLVDRPHIVAFAARLSGNIVERELQPSGELQVAGEADQVVVVQIRDLGVGGAQFRQMRQQSWFGHRACSHSREAAQRASPARTAGGDERITQMWCVRSSLNGWVRWCSRR